MRETRKEDDLWFYLLWFKLCWNKDGASWGTWTLGESASYQGIENDAPIVVYEGFDLTI